MDALRGYLHKFVISTRRRASTVRDLDGSRDPRVSTTWRRVSARRGLEEFGPADLCPSSWGLLCRAASGIARIISISSRANLERGKVRVKRFHFYTENRFVWWLAYTEWMDEENLLGRKIIRTWLELDIYYFLRYDDNCSLE